ncbi:3-hydroxyacyl-CoA dehydrogenase family protein [Arthrobacter agilis]|uniref:3-hydroxyacyl-CoA dehydrogenase family protein n=1 Tax=Arthrobacter agilis TaxID=37921 RepID=UPI000B34C8A7|nr:3-hydroxyacyl-CoA dehydrogenase family protein [Arthrobacter agilis]OUM42981.1 3-hydroxybutyryl-CoA dehydrogenase [Arthrobacter agilis]PPB45926.1 3-hydroxyacyl-CoA dehydrogenase family protein [Arthrobacter agilis]TPV25467.1 3-hydroxyacyl-CoA dehydrogenase family protein [Arthrobacter agilis]VDR33209.1 3-hydroxybutyryl-CoA dehydrogenase [Arthrobacter agilis]
MTTPTGIPAHVGVLGGGRMGAGIAHAFCLAGADVVVVERDGAAAEAGLERVTQALGRSVDRGTTPEDLAALTARVSVSTDHAAFAACGLVVEAVPEDPELKRHALRAVEDVLDDGAWLATNTSSLSVDELAAALQRPERFCGLHFFNPVPASTLIEVVLGARTSTELEEAARAWVGALGKTAVVVRDTPGFASSRLGVALALEAMRMLEEGVATAEDIDAAMVLGYRHPVGPLRTTDMVGLDVRLGIAEYLESTLGPRFTPPAILRDTVARGHLGRKSGRGFFDWEDGASAPVSPAQPAKGERP